MPILYIYVCRFIVAVARDRCLCWTLLLHAPRWQLVSMHYTASPRSQSHKQIWLTGAKYDLTGDLKSTWESQMTDCDLPWIWLTAATSHSENTATVLGLCTCDKLQQINSKCKIILLTLITVFIYTVTYAMYYRLSLRVAGSNYYMLYAWSTLHKMLEMYQSIWLLITIY
jgi:hypothetical protein